MRRLVFQLWILTVLFTTNAYITNLEASPLHDPGCNDTWAATSVINAPLARQQHVAFWTGSEMIVWGGTVGGVGQTNTGGRYNPGTDSWTPTSTTSAAAARNLFSAVWTGTEMIVWGGYAFSGLTNTGGRYNPSTDSWTP